MSTRRRGPKSLKRKVGLRPERRTILIYCEGEGTEPDYLRGLSNVSEVARNAAINIKVELGGGVPLTLVKRAVGRVVDAEIDECWCVFDVEWPKNHPNLLQAVELARMHGVKLAISNPNFELWLILHFKGYAKFINSTSAEKESRKLDGRPGKRIDASVYMPKRREAIANSQVLIERHEANGTSFPHDNPSSTMHSLLIAIEPDLA